VIRQPISVGLETVENIASQLGSTGSDSTRAITDWDKSTFRLHFNLKGLDFWQRQYLKSSRLTQAKIMLTDSWKGTCAVLFSVFFSDIMHNPTIRMDSIHAVEKLHLAQFDEYNAKR